jgi:DNA-directed RNA polymerase subunit M/transcription elongation factor TFIIS
MPDIFFKCEACGNHLVVDEARRGLTVACPDCHTPVAIPTMLNVQQCPRCGQRLMIAPEMKGVLVHCPSCREAIRTPGLCSDQGAEESAVLMVCPRCRASVAITEEISNRPTPCPSCGELVYFRDALQIKGSQNPEPPKPKENDPLRFRRKSR